MKVDLYEIQGKIKPEVAEMWYRFYPLDLQASFRDLIKSKVNKSFTVLEIGAGSGRGDQQAFPLKGTVAKYLGVDLDPRVLDNPQLDEAYISNAADLPFANNSIDLVFNTMVAEHLSDPVLVLKEIYRVLKPGGTAFFETVNKYYYPMIVASVTPHWVHEVYIKKFASGRRANNVFPTYYRFNSKRSIESCCRKANFSRTEISFHSLPPGYLRFNKFIFLLGVVYERTIERLLPALRGRIVIKCIK